MLSDISKIRKYEKQKQIDRIKTIYFASVAHDLRTPINSIMGTT
jgi:signal transduction histidine kinase